MKKFLTNPKKLLYVGMILAVIAMVDALIVDAANFSDLHWWGLIPTYIFMGIIAYLGVLMLFIPLIKWIGNLFKK